MRIYFVPDEEKVGYVEDVKSKNVRKLVEVLQSLKEGRFIEGEMPERCH